VEIIGNNNSKCNASNTVTILVEPSSPECLEQGYYRNCCFDSHQDPSLPCGSGSTCGPGVLNSLHSNLNHPSLGFPKEAPLQGLVVPTLCPLALSALLARVQRGYLVTWPVAFFRLRKCWSLNICLPQAFLSLDCLVSFSSWDPGLPHLL
jgi:hypothetical protein